MEVRIFQSENEVYQKQKLLGEGAFGKAYLVRKRQTGQQLVIKQLNIDHMSQQQREETVKEAQILRNLKHPLIVRFVQVYATKQNKLKIVMEYAECGDLSKAIATRRSEKKIFQENQILDWFTQICLAMKHVHDRKILHRDIKGQNIFITKTNTLKLGDFGIARVLNKTQDKARTVVGTPYYLSPEIIENKPYSFKSDVWSMGVLLYEMCALSPPFTANSLQFLALKIVKGSYTPLTGNYSKQLKSLIGELLQLDPNKRPNVGDILKKPLFLDRIRKYLSQTYRKQQFSHTVLHNHKIQIANKLVKMQDGKRVENDVPKQKGFQNQRNALKEEAAALKQKMDKKRQEEKLKEEQRYRRKKQEQLQKKQIQNQKRRQYDQKIKQAEQKKAVQERKQWIQREKRKQSQQKRNMADDERRRVQEIAQMARKRDKYQQQLMAKKEKLIQQKYQIERQRQMQQQDRRKKQNKDKEAKKMDQFNEFARKQWYQNQMIRKKAEERARQSQMQAFSQPQYVPQQPKLQQQRPQSNKDIRGNSRQNKQSSYQAPKKHSMPQYQPSQQELENAFCNPNFNKKTPQSAQNKHKTNSTNNSVNSSNSSSRVKQSPKIKQEESNATKKHYDDSRDQIRKDREQFLKNKGMKKQSGNAIDQQTLKPSKWERKSREKSHQTEAKNQVKKPSESPKKIPEESIMNSEDLKIDIKDKQQFDEYLNELQGLLDNVNKNIENMQNNEKKTPFPEIPVVQQKIVMRQDDGEELDYSITASFDALLPGAEKMNVQNADFNYFSDYSKLEDLRICLEDKFGTDTFIKIYRTLQSELQTKGLQNFDILAVVEKVQGIVDPALITNNLPLLLTLIVMEQKMR